MSMPTSIVVQVEPSLLADLDRLAAENRRSREWLIERAIANLVRDEAEWQESLDEAEREIERGEFYTQEEMEEWAAGLRQAQAAE